MHNLAQNVFRNDGSAGVDNQSIEEYEETYKLNMRELHPQLKENRYEPSPVLYRIREITRRQQPWSVDMILGELNPIIRGWGNYFGKGNVKKLFQ